METHEIKCPANRKCEIVCSNVKKRNEQTNAWHKNKVFRKWHLPCEITRLPMANWILWLGPQECCDFICAPDIVSSCHQHNQRWDFLRWLRPRFCVEMATQPIASLCVCVCWKLAIFEIFNALHTAWVFGNRRNVYSPYTSAATQFQNMHTRQQKHYNYARVCVWCIWKWIWPFVSGSNCFLHLYEIV